MDNFFEQATQITKAYAYDIVSEQVKELKEENETLRSKLKYSELMLEAYKDLVKDYREFVSDFRSKEVIETA